jgi:hypothetical protein
VLGNDVFCAASGDDDGASLFVRALGERGSRLIRLP